MSDLTHPGSSLHDAWAAIASKKVVLVREAISIERVDEIIAAASNIYAAREELVSQQRLPPEMTARYTRRTILLSEFSSGHAWAEQLRTHPIIESISGAYLSKVAAPMPDSFVRSISPVRAENHLPYHQDQTISGRRLLNIWVALSECGSNAPGLEFIRANDAILPVIGDPSHSVAVERARLDEADLRSRFPSEAFWRPVFQPGDAAVFLGTTIHRTWSPPGATHSRMSLELRLA